MASDLQWMSRDTDREEKVRKLSLGCLMSGHDDRIQRVPGRVFLKCAECGRETQGWALSEQSITALPHSVVTGANEEQTA
jgi:hypothetical protein